MTKFQLTSKFQVRSSKFEDPSRGCSRKERQKRKNRAGGAGSTGFGGGAEGPDASGRRLSWVCTASAAVFLGQIRDMGKGGFPGGKRMEELRGEATGNRTQGQPFGHQIQPCADNFSQFMPGLL